MPVSDIGNLTPICRTIQGLMPERLLDCGIGMGKYGALAREILDFAHGRFYPSTWEHEIDGIEGHFLYRNAMWNLYSEVKVADFTACQMTDYDLVLMIDSLEHLEDGLAQTTLDYLRHNNGHVIVSCPDGDYPQGAAFGNEYERHRSVWTAERLAAQGGTIIHRGVCAVALF